MSKKRFLWLSAGMLLLLTGLFAFRIKDKYFEIAKSLDIMAAVYRNLNTYYVDSLDPAALMQSGIQAMTQSLDPYTTYYPEKNLDRLDFQTTGHYAGIGASFRMLDDSIAISALYPNAPFQKAGFKPGDVILSLNGIKVTGMTPDAVHTLLEGEPNTFLEVEIKRPWTGSVIRKKVKRKTISIPVIPYKTILNGHLGYIRFQQFTEGSGAVFANAVQSLKMEDPHLKGLIVDLRGNPGGLLGEAVHICNLFLPIGDTIVSVKGRKTSWNHVYTATNRPLDTLIHLAVLVNNHTASAAEIFSGAMQDLDRGVIIGQPSFGKGLVQITRDLPYDSKLKLTVARYYTPSGRCIQAIDYAHRDNYGSPVYIPDSLQQLFNTADGRIVHDKGGITPDKVVADPYLSDVESALLNSDQLFRFATHYVYLHPEAPSLEKFKMNDSLFTAFKTFIQQHPVEYKTRSERALEQFHANAVSEGYFDSVKTAFNRLNHSIEKFAHPSLDKHRVAISQLLAAEIMNCYYAREGKIAVGIQSDKVVFKAIEVLKNDSLYADILR